MINTHADVRVYRDGATAYARVLAPIDADTVPALQQRLDAILREPCPILALDLGASDYVDSDGIRWLQRLQHDLRGRKIGLRIAVRQGSRVERTLKLLKLEGHFAIDLYPAEAVDERPLPSHVTAS